LARRAMGLNGRWNDQTSRPQTLADALDIIALHTRRGLILKVGPSRGRVGPFPFPSKATIGPIAQRSLTFDNHFESIVWPKAKQEYALPPITLLKEWCPESSPAAPAATINGIK